MDAGSIDLGGSIATITNIIGTVINGIPQWGWMIIMGGIFFYMVKVRRKS